MTKKKDSKSYEKRVQDTIKSLNYQLQDFKQAFPQSFKEFLNDSNNQASLRSISAYVQKWFLFN